MQVYDAKKLQHNFFSPHHSPEKHFLTNLSKAMITQSGWLSLYFLFLERRRIPLTQGCFVEVWLKLTLWFWRRF